MILTLLSFTTVHAANDMIGVSFSGDAFRIDSTSGLITPIGPTGFTRLNSMAKDNAGNIYSAANAASSTLIRIDTATGVAIAMANMTFQEAGDVRAMGISPTTGQMYVANDILNGGGLGADKIYRVNIATGATTFIGQSGLTGLQALEFAPDGTLYGWAFGTGHHGLCTINLTTGAASWVNASLTPRNIQTLAFAPDGTLFGLGPLDAFPYSDALFKINRTTGIDTQWAADTAVNRDIRGMEFIPEPSAVALTVLPAAVAAAVARRRSRPRAEDARATRGFP